MKNTARLVAATLIVLVMVVGKSFLVPLAWALMIAMASYPMLDRMEQKSHISRPLVITIFLLGLLVVLAGIGYFFYVELSSIFKDLPTLTNTISDRLNGLSQQLAKAGVAIPDHVDKSFLSGWVAKHGDTISNALSSVGLNIWNIILIMFYTFFLLYYRDLIFEFLTRRGEKQNNREMMEKRLDQSLDITRNYIKGLMVITLVSAVMNYVIFLLFGLKFALFFGIFLAILNLIPYIGNPVGLVVIMLFAFVTMDGYTKPLLLFIALFFINFLQDNVVRPWIMGDKMQVNAFAVFVTVIVGSMIWGVSGMILFIPLVGIIKIFIETSKSFSDYALLFADLPKKPKKAAKGKKAEE